MVDFALSEQQLAFRDTARKFAREIMQPVAAKYDQSMDYPVDIIKAAHENGLMNISLPESLGGLGLSHLDQVIVSEEISYGCTGIGTAMAANDLALGPLLVAGNKEQLELLAKPMSEQPTMAAYCVTEPGAGSDVAAIRTTAKADGDHYVLNGEKMWITNGSKAKWYYVLATMDTKGGHKSMVSFALPADLPGITPGKKEINVGQRCSDTRAIIFKDVKVPKKFLLGKEGEGFKITMKAFDLSRPAVAAGAVGLAQCAFDHATKYALQRKTFGKAIAEHQAIAFMIADMAKDIEAARLLVWKSAAELDAGRRNTKFASMAKCFAGDIAVRIVSDAVQVFGGYGYNTEYPVEKLYRDAKIYQIYEGTQQIQRMIIAKNVFDEAAT